MRFFTDENMLDEVDLDELLGEEGFWYLATPYTKYKRGLDRAFRDACEVSALLIGRDVMVYSPIAHSHSIALYGGLDPLDKMWLEFNRPMMDTACGLIVPTLDGWDKSEGVAYEMDIFAQAEKPMIFMELE